MSDSSQEGEIYLVNVVFGEGALGVTLRRRPQDGVVFVYDIVENSQAVNMDINIDDELWAIGDSEIGDVALDKEAWNGLVQYIKFSPRPLKAVWKRLERSRPDTPDSDIIDSNQVDTSNLNQYEESEDEEITIGLQQTSFHKEKIVKESKVGPPKPPKPFKPKNPFESNDISIDEPISLSSSDGDSDLVKLSSRLVLKEKEKSTFASGFSSIAKRNTDSTVIAINLVKDGRQILKIGDLETTSKAALAMWTTQNKRQFILLTDILIVAIPMGPTLQIENMIDLQVCKLYCEGNTQSDTRSTSFTSNSGQNGAVEANDFQLIWPGGTLQIIAKNAEEKLSWVENIFAAICDCVEVDSSDVLGWRHQYMMGTMHSAVISRDVAKVKDLIAKCDSGKLDMSVIDSLDEDGYSPLHYACILRLPVIIRMLHLAGANVIMEDARGLTALHWAALQLDEQALSILCEHVVDIDVADGKGRTPLYLACVEGRDVSGRSDTKSLNMCVIIMLGQNADIDIIDNNGYTLLHYLAASWQHEPLLSILEHKVKTSVFTFSSEDGMNVLHYAADASPLKRAIGEGSRILSNTNTRSVSSPVRVG
jgi:hypothetical protein